MNYSEIREVNSYDYLINIDNCINTLTNDFTEDATSELIGKPLRYTEGTAFKDYVATFTLDTITCTVYKKLLNKGFSISERIFKGDDNLWYKVWIIHDRFIID